MTEKCLAIIQNFLCQCGVTGISAARWALLDSFRRDLLAANQEMNLTRITDEDEFWFKHVLDSLALGMVVPDLFQAPRRVADVGCGAGFPLLPLAWANARLSLTGIESNRNKCDFLLRECARLKLENCGVLARQAREAGRLPEHRGAYDLVTCRAVTRPDRLLRECRQLLKADTAACLALYSTPAAIAEHAALFRREAGKFRFSLRFSAPLLLPEDHGERQFVLLSPAPAI